MVILAVLYGTCTVDIKVQAHPTRASLCIHVTHKRYTYTLNIRIAMKYPMILSYIIDRLF